MLRWGNFLKLRSFLTSVTCRQRSSRPTDIDKVAKVKFSETSSSIETSDYPTKSKIWVSYGFDDEDKAYDRHYMHSTMFFAVTLCLVGGTFVMCYLPDPQLRDWARREAYLQLRFREENGLPKIDPNYIDPEQIILPTDEELGDMEVII